MSGHAPAPASVVSFATIPMPSYSTQFQHQAFPDKQSSSTMHPSLLEHEHEDDLCGICFKDSAEATQQPIVIGGGWPVKKDVAIFACSLPACNARYCTPCLARYVNEARWDDEFDFYDEDGSVLCPQCRREWCTKRIKSHIITYQLSSVFAPRPTARWHAYRPWIARFHQSRPLEVSDEADIALFIRYVYHHAVEDRYIEAHGESEQVFHIHCCVQAWSEQFDIDTETTYAFLNATTGICADAAQYHRIATDFERRGSPAPIVEAVPTPPLFSLPHTAFRLGPIRSAAARTHTRSYRPVSHLGQAAIVCLQQLSKAFTDYHLPGWANSCGQLEGLIKQGQYERPASDDREEVVRFLVELTHTPNLALVCRSVALLPLARLVGATMSTVRTRPLQGMPETGPVADILASMAA